LEQILIFVGLRLNPIWQNPPSRTLWQKHRLHLRFWDFCDSNREKRIYGTSVRWWALSDQVTLSCLSETCSQGLQTFASWRSKSIVIEGLPLAEKKSLYTHWQTLVSFLFGEVDISYKFSIYYKYLQRLHIFCYWVEFFMTFWNTPVRLNLVEWVMELFPTVRVLYKNYLQEQQFCVLGSSRHSISFNMFSISWELGKLFVNCIKIHSICIYYLLFFSLYSINEPCPAATRRVIGSGKMRKDY